MLKGHQNATWASGHEKVHLKHFIAKFLLNGAENQGMAENGHFSVFWTSGFRPHEVRILQ